MLGYCLRKPEKMKIKAYFWSNKETTYDDKPLWNHEENGKKYIKYGDVVHELRNGDFICEKSEGVFYRVGNEEFKQIYDIDSFEDGYYTRKISGVLAYDPNKTEFDELGNRLFYFDYNKNKYIIRQGFIEKLTVDAIVCKNILGVLYQLPKEQFIESYIYKGE